MEFESFSSKLREYIDNLTNDLRKCMPKGMDININDIHLKVWNIVLTYKIYCDDEDIEDEDAFEPLLLRMNLGFIEVYRDSFVDLIRKIVSGDKNKLYDNAVNMLNQSVTDNNVFVFFDIIDDNGNILMNYDKLIGSIFK